MAKKLWAAIVTPTEQVVRAEVDMVVAPSVQGEVGILPDHQPLLAVLEPGAVQLRVGDKADVFAVGGGFVEVDRDKVTILAEVAERATDIDTARAQAALAEANTRMKALDPLGEEYAAERNRAKRAEVRLRVAAH